VNNEKVLRTQERSRPLKLIQIFNQYLQPGGEEKSVARIADHLEHGGYEVHRFWRASTEWTGPERPWIGWQPFLMWNNRRVLGELRQIQERVKADMWVVHNVLPVVSLGVYRLAKQLGVPIIHWLHNYRPISPSGTLVAGGTMIRPDDPFIYLKESLHGTYNGRVATAWLSLCYLRAYKRGDFAPVKAWVALSGYMKGLFDRARWPLHPVFVLRHDWNVEPPPTNQSPGKTFLFLGRMVETKGVRFLIDLWRHPELKSYQLIMAGKGPLADELRDQSPPNVSWVGHVEGEEKRQLLLQCRAAVFPCLWPEPLGTVVYEAYQVCKPVLASDLGGLRETIRHNVTGLLLPPAQMDAWRSAIFRIAQDDALALRLGRNGRRWLEAEASPESWLRGFQAVLEEASAKSESNN